MLHNGPRAVVLLSSDSLHRAVSEKVKLYELTVSGAHWAPDGIKERIRGRREENKLLILLFFFFRRVNVYLSTVNALNL